MSEKKTDSSALFYNMPRLTILLVGLIMVAGISTMLSLPRQEDPTLIKRYGYIVTLTPGASAERMENLVTEKIEKTLKEIPEVVEMTSTSQAGISIINVQLDDSIIEVTPHWSKVRNKLSDVQAQLPPGTTNPDLREITSKASTMMVSLQWAGDGEPQMDILTRLAEDLENLMRSVPGTEETNLYGDAQEEIRVTLDPLAMASANITTAEISRAIAEADSKTPAGKMRHSANDLLIEVAGELKSIQRIRDIPLRQEAGGSFLRLGDIARVDKTVADPAPVIALIAGEPGVIVEARMQDNNRVDLWAKQAHKLVDGFEEGLPSTVKLRILFDQSVYVDQTLTSLVENFSMAVVLVMLVLFVMMGWRSALLVSLSLPLTLLMVMTGFGIAGLSLNQMSATGLIIALGLLIDNAIVVVDDFNKFRNEGYSRQGAVAKSVRTLFVPLLASTLTTCFAFLPIALAPGSAGEFVGPMALAVVMSVLASFFLAMTIVPAISGFFARDRAKGPQVHRWWRDGLQIPFLAKIYASTIRLALRIPVLGVLVSVILPIAGFIIWPTLPEQFFPANDRNMFQIQIELPPQTSKAETLRAIKKVRGLLKQEKDIVETYFFIGQASPPVYYNMQGVKDGLSYFASGWVLTTSPDATDRMLPMLQLRLKDEMPEALILTLPFEQGPPVEAPIEVVIKGPELSTLRLLGEEIRILLQATPGVTYTRAKLSGGQPKLMLVPDEDEAQMAGVRLVDIARQLQANLDGSLGGTIIEGSQEIPVVVRVDEQSRSGIEAISSTHLFSSLRAQDTAARPSTIPGVPISALTNVTLIPETSSITRREGIRTNDVQAFLVPYYLASIVLSDFKERLAASDFDVPPGYTVEFGGETADRSTALNAFLAFVPPLLILMVGTVILSFNSFRFAGYIGIVAILSAGLAFFGVGIFGYPRGFLAVVGMLGLIGLAINGAIVVLTLLKENERSMAGDLDAMHHVVMHATRHILATTLTTIGGFVPLIVFGGRFWPPLATAIAGGVAGSAILALYLTPSLFSWGIRRDIKRATKKAAKLAAKQAAIQAANAPAEPSATPAE